MVDINIYSVGENYGGDFMKFCIRKAENDIPEWYKKSESYVGGTANSPIKDKFQSVKRCMPVFDYLSAGLNIHLPFAIYAEGTYLNQRVSSSTTDFDCKLGHHSPEQVQKMPISKEYSSQPYKVDFPFYIEAPAGYSAVYIPYYPYEGYPLLFIGATVQVDKYKAPVNFPFLIRSDFEGKVDAGTMFMKVIFVKREKTSINYKEFGSDKGFLKQTRLLVESFGAGFYRNLRLDQIFPK